MAEARHTTTDYRYAPLPEPLLYDATISATAVRVYACLMRHGLDPSSCYPSHARIADLIGVAERSVQRPLRDLERAGWIERHPRHADSGQRITDGYLVRTTSAQDRAPTALFSADPPARVARAEARGKGKGNDSQEERKAPADAEARALVQRVWERCTPKPATPFIAAVKIAAKLLAAGHPAKAIEEAMVAVPTISTGWVEGELRKRSTTAGPNRTNVHRVVDDPEARARPSERLHL